MAHLPGVASVGLIENRPNSRNVVPGEVFFTVDLRHPDETVLDKMEAAFRPRCRRLPNEKLELEEKCIWNSPAVKFDPDSSNVCARAARRRAIMREMASGAGHDAAYIARVAPTTMIFVPALAAFRTMKRNPRRWRNAVRAPRCC